MGFAELPAELQIQIFGYLERPDLKAARGVSRKFRDNASPNLFASVITCARYFALSAMQKISLHPIYQKYVKELVFDGSVYNGALAGKFERYKEQASQCAEVDSGFGWEHIKRYQQYQLLYREQEDMRTGGVLIHEISRALEWMPNIASVVYSPGPRLVPVERKLMKNILPRGVVHRFSPHVHGESSDSYVDSCQRGIHHLIGAIYASQYSGVREFRVEVAESMRGTEFTIFVFDFPDPQHLEAGRFFFRKLHKLDMNISLQEPGLPHDRGHVPTHPNARALTQLSNFSNLLSESIDLRELSLHLVHWQSSAQRTYGHAIPPGHPIFPLLGLNTKWPKLRSLSLGGIYAAEEQLIRVLTRHKETLEELDFKLCSLVSGSWANIVDHVLYNSSILKFCLRKVNETVVGDRDFEDLTSEEMEHWQYEGTLKRDLEGVRYFDEPKSKTVYSGRRQVVEEE